ncbi:MAG: AraC family transcriptional regulator [Myxococcales bacterium]|nr:AraC family transcriptional regulator [Myxococcales bacterium]
MPPADRHAVEYQNRVNRVIDYVQQHRAEDLSLETLAQVAAFSPFHFHRVFKATTGENLAEFVQRVRLEWAGGALLARRGDDVLAVALDAGFQSAGAFARAFKEHFGMTATQWRSGGAAQWRADRVADRKMREAVRKACEAAQEGAAYGPAMDITVRTLPTHHLAYVRVIGPYGPGGGIASAWRRLMTWASARELWTPDRLCIGIGHDNPGITAPDRCRYDAGIVVPAGLAVDAQVNTVDLPGTKYCIAPFDGTAAEVGGCWDRVFSEWFPGSGYQPGDGPCIELYHGDAWDVATGRIRCELCVPIRPL